MKNCLVIYLDPHYLNGLGPYSILPPGAGGQRTCNKSTSEAYKRRV